MLVGFRTSTLELLPLPHVQEPSRQPILTMHSDIVRGLGMLESVTQFRADHPVEPENERAEELFAEVSSAVDDLRAMGGSQ